MKSKLLTILFLCLFLTSFAQKSAPVAGDAATLLDLLKKDYNAVDPESRNEQFSKDMFKAISIFKGYLTDSKRLELINQNKVTRLDSCKEILTRLNDSADFNFDSSTFNAQDFCGKLDELHSYFESYSKNKKIYEAARNSNSEYISNDLEEYADSLTKASQNYFNLKFYSDLKNLEQLRVQYQASKNTYIAHIISNLIKKYKIVFNNEDDFMAQINYSSSVQKALPFLGGDLSFETIIDGLSKFLAKRIKEELTTHAIEKIQNYLNNPSQESYLNELLVLLPQTTDYLKSFEASQVLNFIDDFKQYIEKDLNNLFLNASNLKSTPRFIKLIEKNPDIGFAFEALDLIPQISKIKEPIDYFDILENSPNLQRWAIDKRKTVKYNIANSINLTSMLAHSLLVIHDGKQKLVSLDFMGNYGSEKEFYLLYLGFLNQQNEKYFNIKFSKLDQTSVAFDLKNLMSSVTPENLVVTQETINSIKNQITSIVANTEKLQEAIESIKKTNKNDNEVTAVSIHNLVSSLVEFSEQVAITADTLIDTIRDNATLPDTEIVGIIGKTKPYFNTAKAVNDIFLDIHNKNFTTAIISALEIPSNFINDETSLFKLTNLKNTLGTSSELLMFRQLLSYKKVPKSAKDKENLDFLAIRFEEVIGRQCLGTFPEIEREFDSLHKIIKSGKNKNFTQQLNKLRTELTKTNVYTSVLEKYANVKVDSIFLEPIGKLIDGLSVNDTRKAELKGYLNNFVVAGFKDFILDDKSGLKKARTEMLRYFTVYLPEFSNEVFNIKDKNVLRIIYFVTDIALAENAQDVETAVEAFALPAGSSSAKEKTSAYVSINSYPGVLLGIEVNDVDNAFHVGFTAPIGLYGQIFKVNYGTWGLFIPIIDIGAPVRLRLDDNSDIETLPDFDFKDIFSPGAYISFGLNDSPFAFNAGIQYGPKLRGIEDDNGNFSDIESFRISLGITIDIPLFNLYNRGID